MQSKEKSIYGLPDELQHYAEEQVRVGNFHDVREVIRAGLEALKSLKEEAQAAHVLPLVEAARADIRAGRFIEGSPSEVMAKVRKADS